MKPDLFRTVTATDIDYLSDESKETGFADTISFPRSEAEILEILKIISQPDHLMTDQFLSEKNEISTRHPEKSGDLCQMITIQGSNTGIKGRSVPHGGHIINLSRMNRLIDTRVLSDGSALAVVEPGLSLSELQQQIDRIFSNKPVFWPPQPTERSASIGGIAVTGASGMNIHYYGATRQYIEAITFITLEGERLHLDRNISPAISKQMDQLLGSLADMDQPTEIGIITELTLKLLPKPESVWGISFFFTDTKQAAACGEELKTYAVPFDDAWIASLEYMDSTAIGMIEAQKEYISAIRSLPDVPEGTSAMIYMQLEGNEKSIEELLMELMEITTGYGSDPDLAWAVNGESEVEKMHAFRHVAAEAVILYTEEKHQSDPRITKLGFDRSDPDVPFPSLISRYQKDLKEYGLRASLYGHIGTGQIYVDILPENYGEYMRGKDLVSKWAKQINENLKGGIL